MEKRTPLIEMSGISFGYPGGKPVLEGLGLTLERGDKIGLVAPNGSGKTTLFHIIMGLLKPTSGTMKIFGREVVSENDFYEVRKRIGFLFQDADDQLFSPTVLEDVAFGPLNLGKSMDEAVEISRRTLSYLGLSGFENRITFKLSGGEKKLVSLATVLAMEPEVLLLDEPSTGLDEKTKESLVEILKGLDLSYILISHEPQFLSATTDRIYTMNRGTIHFDQEAYIHSHEHIHSPGDPHPHAHH